ncbi:MAG: HAD family phosphatase [Verrucomicrobiota bacterium]
MTMVDAIIFDIGNVLLRFDFTRAIKRIAPFCTVAPTAIQELLEPWKLDLESGRISGSDFLDEVTHVLGYSGLRAELQSAWQEIFSANLPMHELVASLRSIKVPLYLLSNTNNLHADYFLSEYPVFAHFTDAVYSHEAGLMKPDIAIYHHALEKFKLAATTTFFIDDLLPNIEAARAVNLIAHHYHHDQHASLLEELRELHVL